MKDVGKMIAGLIVFSMMCPAYAVDVEQAMKGLQALNAEFDAGAPIKKKSDCKEGTLRPDGTCLIRTEKGEPYKKTTSARCDCTDTEIKTECVDPYTDPETGEHKCKALDEEEVCIKHVWRPGQIDTKVDYTSFFKIEKPEVYARTKAKQKSSAVGIGSGLLAGLSVGVISGLALRFIAKTSPATAAIIGLSAGAATAVGTGWYVRKENKQKVYDQTYSDELTRARTAPYSLPTQITTKIINTQIIDRNPPFGSECW
ncbi:hypothetical protein ACFL6Y_08350 [Elusimicrobiota bacterium]